MSDDDVRAAAQRRLRPAAERRIRPGAERRIRTAAQRRVIAYPEALAAARRRFLATGGLAMDRLADDLWVSRATLYRVVGSRDRLLGDVLWQLAERTLSRVVERVDGLTGTERLLEISRRFNDEVSRFAPLQRFITQEPGDATLILFGTTARVHVRMVEAWAALFRHALARGGLDGLPFGVEETAFVFVRIGESILYGGMLAGVAVDHRLSEHLRRTLLVGR